MRFQHKSLERIKCKTGHVSKMEFTQKSCFEITFSRRSFEVRRQGTNVRVWDKKQSFNQEQIDWLNSYAGFDNVKQNNFDSLSELMGKKKDCGGLGWELQMQPGQIKRWVTNEIKKRNSTSSATESTCINNESSEESCSTSIGSTTNAPNETKQ